VAKKIEDRRREIIDEPHMVQNGKVLRREKKAA